MTLLQLRRTGISALFIGLALSALSFVTVGAADLAGKDAMVQASGSGVPLSSEAGPALSVDVSAGRHAISEDIYGMNYTDEGLAADIRLPVRRFGGNATTRYNWQNDTSNRGSDWFFENVPESNSDPGALPDGSSADLFVEQNRRTATQTLMTVPLIGWTPKRRPDGHPYDCGFKVSKYGEQQSTDGWDTDCGNGISLDGSDITTNDPEDTSMAIGPSFVASWIDHLISRYGTAANGGVAYYDLDNEPMLWNSTHRDVHPQATTYDEIRDRTYQYAAAVKTADPSAKTLGPVVWGWCAYLYSAADGCSSYGADYQAHGGTAFVPWYLQQMKSYEQQHGVRILDYVDLHIYPQINGVFSDSQGSADIQAARLRSTRQLWDPSYVHEGWINEPVYLIPRMKKWVADNYPGTKTAISEYSWGALAYLNGALAEADILGIFGREGLDLATLWGPPASDDPGAFAFRLFRNYDGAGHGFGDSSVQASSSDQGVLSIYAAQRSADQAVTIMIINKSAESLTSTVDLYGFSPASRASVYRYSAVDLHRIEPLADQAVSAVGFDSLFPANSITLLVLTPDGSQPAVPPTAPTGLTVQ
jgi:Glycoside hydrolase family 44